MKSIWVLVLSAATVTFYFHVRHHEPIVMPVKHQNVPVISAPPKSAGDIVVAPYAGGSVGSRWEGVLASPAPPDSGKRP
jgi:hypothetical protein